MRTLTPWLIGMALALAPAAARAEEPTKTYPECGRTPTDAEVAAAKGAYQAGTASFEEADYGRAIDYWEDAYRRDCTADALLLNLARAYELSGRKRQAVVALETYLQRQPNAGQKDQINRRIDVLKKQIGQESPAPAATPAASPAQAAEPAPANPSEPQAEAAPVPDQPVQGKRSIVPLIVAGAGGVVLIVGSAIYFPASSDVAEFERICGTNRKCPEANYDAINAGNEARSKQNLGGGLMIGGAVVAVGGVVWYFLSPRKPAATATTEPVPRRASVTPLLFPGFAGLAVDGRF
jgi:tetratricopeptide (TPR) repeat protein